MVRQARKQGAHFLRPLRATLRFFSSHTPLTRNLYPQSCNVNIAVARSPFRIASEGVTLSLRTGRPPADALIRFAGIISHAWLLHATRGVCVVLG
jgi:hypothetical protein